MMPDLGIRALSKSSGKYLVLDPGEIFQDDGNADEIRTREILGLIDDCDRTEVVEMIAIDFFSRHLRKLDSEEARLCLIGYDYPE